MAMVLVLATTLACASGVTAQQRDGAPSSMLTVTPTGFGASVDTALARVRAATAPFKSIDKAAAAGYPKAVSNCLAHPQHGGMGYHHQKDALLDTKIEIEKPEILVYNRRENGDYTLNGVEYIIPLEQWTKSEAPTVMGQKMKRAPSLGIWYLHVWTEETNPEGLFADWNPKVKCPG
jgi:hypothetical protein